MLLYDDDYDDDDDTIHRQQNFLSVRFITKNILNQRILLHWAGAHYTTGNNNTNDRAVSNALAGHAFEIPTPDISSNRFRTECVYMYVTFKTTEHFNCLSAWIPSCFRQSILHKLCSFKDKTFNTFSAGKSIPLIFLLTEDCEQYKQLNLSRFLG